MKKKSVLISLLFLLLAASVGFAADFKAEQPILITSGGQSADVLMVKILVQRAGLDFTYDKLATSEALEKQNALIIVCGGSAKGLGAANIDKEEEKARVQSIIDRAMADTISIITMHVGGKARRGKLSDEFNNLAANSADCLIVVKSGDEDKFFSTVSEKKEIPIFLVDKILDAGDILKSIFSKAE